VSDPYAPFVPRRGRQVALGFGVASLLLFGVLALVVPSTGLPGWSALDSWLLFGFGVLVAAAMWRFAALRAIPSPGGLVVRNVLLTRTVAWGQITRVRFAGGDPWVVLDLSDGEQLAVMAVQKSDGGFARAESRRLAALVQAGRGRRG
jgi:hypothetical protein